MTAPPEQLSPRVASDLLAGGGEMGERMRAFDWSQTPVGPVEGWPQSLRTAVSICLNSKFPMVIWWGPELTLVYNDGWIPILGPAKHPRALGSPGREIWPEIWDVIGPMFESVMITGQATWSDDGLLLVNRYGYTEEAYFTWSYSPIRDESGGVGGVFTAVTETTTRVVGERRLKTLRELGERGLAEAGIAEQACRAAAAALAGNPHDFPFALIYLLDKEGQQARLCGTVNLPPGTAMSPETVAVGSRGDVWGFLRAVETNQGQLAEGLEERFGRLPAGPWADDWTKRALVLPLARAGAQELPAGFLVAGISPRLAFEDDYRSFLDLTAGQIATAIANARAHEETRRRAEALAEIDRAKTDFFSNLSHEFRTPLTLMLGPLKDTLADPRLPAPDRELLDVAHRNSLRLLKLVNTLLDFSRIEAGRIQASYEPTDLGAFTADLASVFRSAVERAGLRLVVDCPPMDEPVYVDREMWEKIVLNLLSNAFKFTFEGAIEVSLRRADRRVELAVRDTGTGIPAEEIPHLFERFHRVKNARGRTFEGSGIGLALVQELVKLHGGTVRAESEVDRGTTFTVSLPLGKAHLPADRIGAERALPSTGSRGEAYVEEALRWLPVGTESPGERNTISSACILLADDNADMREYVRRLLSEHYEVVAVPDGAAALQAAREQPFDLVLSDVMMPRLDGFGLLAALRSDERTKTLPVILLSARAGEESRVEGLQAGADDYLFKPFSARELLARVDAHLRLQRVRREAQAALRASEAKFSTAFDQTPLALTITSLDDGRFVEVNEGFVRLSGYAREEALGRRPEDLGLWTDPELRAERFARLRMGKPVPNIEVRFRVKSGEELIGVIGSAIVEINGRPCVLSSVIDVTEQKKAEIHQDLLLQVAEKIRLAEDAETLLGEMAQVIGERLGLARCAFDEIDLAGGVARVHCDYYAPGLAPGPREWAVESFSAVNLDEMKAGRTIVVSDAGTDERTAPLYESNYRPHGYEAYVSIPLMREGRWIASLWVNKETPHPWSPQEVALLETVAERTWLAVERLRSEAALRASEQALKEADRRKDEFLAMLAHELRNPLAPIRNAAQVLKLLGPADARQQWAREIIERQTQHLTRLVDDLLDVSRITRGKVKLAREPLDLAAVVQRAVEASRPLIDARRHQLTVALPPEPVRLEGDLTRLVQVVGNLLNNAAKYTDEGGHIRLEAAREDGQVVLRVRDNGMGLPADLLPHVFDLFSQADRSLDRSQGGLGVGLTLVRRLVELHGGRVEARSGGPGQGSEFIVRLPAEASGAASGGGAAAGQSPRPAPGGLKVLIVEDNVDSAKMMSFMLELGGHQVRTAYDGAEALEAARAFGPHAVLCDIGLPGMNGYEVAARLRQQPDFQRTPLIALTGYGEEEARRRSKEAGFDYHLVKPVEPDALGALLGSLRGTPGRA
jgi:PAS domain S-box-containing protein